MPNLHELGSSLILRSPNWLGDAVMTLPAVQLLLKSRAVSQKVSVLTPAKLADFWKLVPGLETVLVADSNIAITADTLRAQKFDSSLIFPNSLRSALEPWLAGINKRYGFKGHSRQWLLSESWPRPSNRQGWVHHQEHYLDLVRNLLGSSVDETSCLHATFSPLPQSDSRPCLDPYLVICAGAEYGSAKRWPLERYASAVREIVSVHPQQIYLLGSATDIPTSLGLAELLPDLAGRIINLTGQTSLREFINYLSHANLVLCNDSGSMHLAAAYGTKAVALFGSTEPLLTGPITDSVKVIRHHVPCSPCFLRDCPIDFRCMKGISVEAVVRESLVLLKTT